MMDLRCLASITVQDPVLRGKTAKTSITCEDLEGARHRFVLELSYEQPLGEAHLPLLRIAATMPLMNYGLFADEIVLEYEVTESDLSLMRDLLDVFSRDVFINKLVRRRADYILHEYLPQDEDITEDNAGARARIVPASRVADSVLSEGLDPDSCGVLSSGGKESLLTYAVLRELGVKVHPLYVNESGGHWRTALTAYRHHATNEPLTGRVWTNVDRFYVFMLDILRIIRRDHRRVRADTYPIRLCIFPFYVFALLPVFLERRIGNLLIGTEFDDPRLEPVHRGIRHYFGIYDQSQDYDLRMEQWYSKRLPGMRQWSALRPVFGLIVERILNSRYPELAASQRSCHSCHFEGDRIVPCGECTKCLGVMLFLRAHKVDPGHLGYRSEDIEAFPARLAKAPLRIDQDEREHAAHLAGLEGMNAREHPHVEGIHIHPATGDIALVPERFRDGILRVLEEYTNGYWALQEDTWMSVEKSDVQL